MHVHLIALVGLLVAGTARAQVSIDVAAVSDYRFRGVSESDLGPALQGSLAFDHPTGLFGGVFVSSIDLGGLDDSDLKVAAFAGLARRMAVDRSWELGAVHYRYPGSTAGIDYSEVFAGLAWRRLSARAHYAHDFFGRGLRSTYLELNARHWLDEHVSLFAHLGVARLQARGWPYGADGETRVDGQVGVSLELPVVSFEVGAVATSTPGSRCPVRGGCGTGIVVAVSRSF